MEFVILTISQTLFYSINKFIYQYRKNNLLQKSYFVQKPKENLKSCLTFTGRSIKLA